jgi:hypothetical protein
VFYFRFYTQKAILAHRFNCYLIKNNNLKLCTRYLILFTKLISNNACYNKLGLLLLVIETKQPTNQPTKERNIMNTFNENSKNNAGQLVDLLQSGQQVCVSFKNEIGEWEVMTGVTKKALMVGAENFNEFLEWRESLEEKHTAVLPPHYYWMAHAKDEGLVCFFPDFAAELVNEKR